MNIIMLVVDVQKALVQGHPYHSEEVINHIQSLLSFCRENKVEVVYVRHDGGAGDELEYGSDGWQIYKEIAPQAGEKIFDKKYCSAFRLTGLKDYLDTKGVKNIILVGMQTQFCIDTTCKIAFEYGYNVLIPEDTITTYDNSYLTGKELCEYYTYAIWKDRFAKVLSIDELEKNISCDKNFE